MTERHRIDRINDLNALLDRARRERFGFFDEGCLTDEEVEALARDPAHCLTSILVRLDSGHRFTAPAQDVRYLTDIIRRAGDRVSNVYLPVREEDAHALVHAVVSMLESTSTPVM